MKVNLKIIKKKGLVLKNMLMVQFMKVILQTEKSVGMENILFQMENIMKAILKMIYMKEKEFMNGQRRVEDIKANFI